MIDVIIRSISGSGNKAHKTTKITFPNRDALKDFMMSMAYNEKACMMDIGKEYRGKK